MTGPPTLARVATGPATLAGVELRPLDPRVRVLWWLSGAIGAIPLVLAALVLDALLELPFGDGWAGWVVALVFAVIVAVGPIVRYRRWRWALRDHDPVHTDRPQAPLAGDLWIRRGAIVVTTSVIPLARLQFVDTRQGPVMRMLGLAELVVHTAAPGTSGVLTGLDQAEAEGLRERLARVAVAGDGL